MDLTPSELDALHKGFEQLTAPADGSAPPPSRPKSSRTQRIR